MASFAFAELGGTSSASADGIVVAGRCWEGPIKVGDEFTRSESFDAGDATPVSLTVTSIQFYGKLVDSLAAGDTAKLTLAGDVRPAALTGWVLRGDAR